MDWLVRPVRPGTGHLFSLVYHKNCPSMGSIKPDQNWPVQPIELQTSWTLLFNFLHFFPKNIFLSHSNTFCVCFFLKNQFFIHLHLLMFLGKSTSSFFLEKRPRHFYFYFFWEKQPVPNSKKRKTQKYLSIQINFAFHHKKAK